MTTAVDSRALQIREILGNSLEVAEISPVDNSNHILYLTYEELELRVKIPGLSEIGWTALMFESAAALEECCGGPCKLSIIQELGTEEWSWDEVNSNQVGIACGGKPDDVVEGRVEVTVVGEFSLNGDGIEAVEYYLGFNNRRYHATITCTDESLRILVGPETFADMKMAVNLGELALSVKQSKRLYPGAVLSCRRPRDHNVLLAVGNNRYAVGEACWMDTGVRLKLAAKY